MISSECAADAAPASGVLTIGCAATWGGSIKGGNSGRLSTLVRRPSGAKGGVVDLFNATPCCSHSGLAGSNTVSLVEAAAAATAATSA